MELHSGESHKHPGQRVFFVMACCVALLIPFHKILPSPMLILTFLGILVSGQYPLKWNRLISNKRYWLFASIYLLAVFGFLLSENKAAATKDMQVRLYALLIPIFFAMAGPLSKKQLWWLLQCYVISCFLFVLTALTIAALRYPQLGSQAFYYKYLVDFTFIHPSYAAMFLVFAVMLVSFEVIQNWSKLSPVLRMIKVVAILVFSFVTLLLTAKLAIACLFIVLSVGFYFWSKHQFGAIKAIFLLIGLNIILFCVMLMLPYTRERMQMLLHYNETTYANSVDSREEIWRSASQVAGEHLIIGTGTGDAEDALVNQYADNGFKVGVEERYNSHNEYLQVLVEAGLPGLALFILFFAACLRLAWRDKNFLWMGFLVLFMVNIITENMLRAQSGVVFFSFFNALLGLHSSRKVD